MSSGQVCSCCFSAQWQSQHPSENPVFVASLLHYSAGKDKINWGFYNLAAIMSYNIYNVPSYIQCHIIQLYLKEQSQFHKWRSGELQWQRKAEINVFKNMKFKCVGYKGGLGSGGKQHDFLALKQVGENCGAKEQLLNTLLMERTVPFHPSIVSGHLQCIFQPTRNHNFHLFSLCKCFVNFLLKSKINNTI